MQIMLRNRACLAAALSLALLVSGVASDGLAQAASEPDSDYEFVRVTYASDYCTQLRQERIEADDTDEDEPDTSSPLVPTVAATSGADTLPTAPAQDDNSGAAQDDEAEADIEPPKLFLRSRFNHESCEDTEVGAVVEDEAELPLLIAALQAAHEALAVQPDWIDDYNLPQDWQGCWRRGARLSGAVVDNADGDIILYLDTQDCSGQDVDVQLLLQLADEEQPQGYRRRGGILATMPPVVVCGTLE